MKNIVSIVFLSLLVLAGCGNDDSYNQTLAKDAQEYSKQIEFSKKYLDLLQAKNFSAIEPYTKLPTDRTGLYKFFNELVNFLPAEPPTDKKLVMLGHNTSVVVGGKTTNTTSVSFEYYYPNEAILVNTAVEDAGDSFTIVGINTFPYPAPMEDVNKFTLQGKTPVEYVFLIATCAIPVFILAALITCIRTPIQKRKWLWILFIIFGLGAVRLNWADGSFGFSLIYLQLFGSGFVKASPYLPTIMATSLPIGALMFFIRRKKLVSGQ